MPNYDDAEALNRIKGMLKGFSEPIGLDEIMLLRKRLNSVESGMGFIIIGGDCAESLNTNANRIVNTITTIQAMADVVSKKIGNEIIKIGRMAGQYAKPRSNEFETIDGITLPSYRGDIINGIEFTGDARKPNPMLMVKALYKTIETLSIIKKIDKNFYTSHEALLLDYEECFIREKYGVAYLSSTHFPWIGDRTRNCNSAHVEFLRGIVNPIGIKCSDNTDLDDLVKIIKLLNSRNEVGKIALTVRMGSEKIEKHLPILINTVMKNNLNVLWISDPMHGNGKKINGKKTRYLEDIENEMSKFFSICNSNGVYPAGIHLEMAGDNITECVGLSVSEDDLNQNYTTLCDPRLNKEQSLYLIKKISQLI